MVRLRAILIGAVAFVGLVQLCIGIFVHNQLVEVDVEVDDSTTNPGRHLESYSFKTAPVPSVTKDGGKQDLSKKAVENPSSSIPTSPIKKYLVFHPIQGYQGLGNIISGLLAAHIFGIEFNRTVCVSTEYTAFHQAFEALRNIEECKGIERIKLNVKKNLISIVNSQPPPNECKLKEKLSSNEPILHHTGNTYPRWPKVPDDFFHRFYKPRKALLDTLPWKEPPRVVVHLREPDWTRDQRKGLDNLTLHTLGRDLPNHTFLVTNRVAWYDFFEQYGWSHPPWTKVTHSATKTKDWGSAENATTSVPKTKEEKEQEKSQQTIRMWSDWYTVLVAGKVYHTHSDFSLSAIHWNNVWSRTIQGSHKVNGSAVLDLDKENWVGVETPLLSDREGAHLKRCVVPGSFMPRPVHRKAPSQSALRRVKANHLNNSSSVARKANFLNNDDERISIKMSTKDRQARMALTATH
jgi:hypothetical protein